MSAELKPNLLSPRWSKVFTDLWDDKTRTGLVVASIAAGVFAIGMILSAYLIMRADIDRSYQAVNPPNIEVQTDPFDDQLVQTIQLVPGVKDVEGRYILGVRARRGAEDWMKLTLVGLDTLESRINLRVPVEGVGLAWRRLAGVVQHMQQAGPIGVSAHRRTRIWSAGATSISSRLSPGPARSITRKSLSASNASRKWCQVPLA